MTRSVRHLIAVVVLTIAGTGAFAATSTSHATAVYNGGPLASATYTTHA